MKNKHFHFNLTLEESKVWGNQSLINIYNEQHSYMATLECLLVVLDSINTDLTPLELF